MRSFTDPPGLRYSTLARTRGPSSPGRSSERLSRTSGVLPIRSRSELAYCTRPILSVTGQYDGAVGKAAAARKLASAAAYGGGGLTALGAGLYGVLRAEAQLREEDHRRASRRGPAGRDRLVRPRTPGPAIKIALLGDSSAAGYGCERVEETPGALLASGVAEQADRRVYLREFAVVGAESRDLAAPGRPHPPDRARPRGHPDRRQRRDPPGAAGDLGGAPRRVRTTPQGRGRRRARRHLPRPRHPQADRPAAQAGRPHLVAAAGRRADDRRARGRRPDRVAGLDPRPRVRRRPGRAVRARPVPPVRRGLPLAGRRACSPRRWPRSASPRRRSPRPPAARACCRSPTPPSRPCATRAPSSTARRSAGDASAYAASGSSCATASASRRPTRTRPRTPRSRLRPDRAQRHDPAPSRRAGLSVSERQLSLKIASRRSRLV